MKLASYCRVSTDAQAESGLGLEVQARAIRKWANDNGHRIVARTEDAGVSGSNGIDTREGLLDAFAAIRERRVSGLVVYRLDRLARDLIIQEQLLAEVWRMGAVLFSTSASEAAYLTDDPDDPSRKLIRQVLGAVSEYERSMISLRLRSGRKRKAEKGGYAYGSPAFGSRAEDGELVTDDHEAAALARIRALREADPNISLRAIAAVLTDEGYKPKRSATWHPESLRKIVARLGQT
jgi:DNA invertase Pin-like site-specific DNA recombinase